MTVPKCCSLSLDLDNKWSYMKTHGDAGWETYPSYLGLVVPRVLSILEQRGWAITFFVVGRDAAIDQNLDVLARIPAAGHEVGNHSYHHEPWLHLYSPQETEIEIRRAEDAIEAATGARPSGFRGPGYSISPSTLSILSRRGYQFDASAFPTYLGPLARAYYFMTSDFSEHEKKQRSAIFGGFRNGFRPLRPYKWRLDSGNLLEIPVTTIPVCKIPFHFSYLLYVGTYSKFLAQLYFRSALRLCDLARIQPSLLLHPLDFLGGDDVPELGFFPAMRLDSREKGEILSRLFDIIDERYTVLSMGRHAQLLEKTGILKTRSTDEVSLGERAWQSHP